MPQPLGHFTCVFCGGDRWQLYIGDGWPEWVHCNCYGCDAYLGKWPTAGLVEGPAMRPGEIGTRGRRGNVEG